LFGGFKLQCDSPSDSSFIAHGQSNARRTNVVLASYLAIRSLLRVRDLSLFILIL